MKIKEGYVVKDIIGNVVVIPIGQAYIQGKDHIRLNSEGAFFVRHIIAGKSEEEIVDLYSDLFSEDYDYSQEELNKFLEYGIQCGFIERD